MKIINANEFAALSVPASDVIDVRTTVEFESIHLPGSTNIPLDILQAGRLPIDASDHTHYLLCASSMRARKGCGVLEGQVKGELVVVDGGIEALKGTAIELAVGKQTLSLERQVRIAAGALVLAGIVLSAVHPAFIVISAFVGAGLMFAGITNHCGMALVLARMPWNRAAGKAA